MNPGAKRRQLDGVAARPRDDAESMLHICKRLLNPTPALPSAAAAPISQRSLAADDCETLGQKPGIGPARMRAIHEAVGTAGRTLRGAAVAAGSVPGAGLPHGAAIAIRIPLLTSLSNARASGTEKDRATSTLVSRHRRSNPWVHKPRAASHRAARYVKFRPVRYSTAHCSAGCSHAC
jgi:hypothetical protein